MEEIEAGRAHPCGADRARFRPKIFAVCLVIDARQARDRPRERAARGPAFPSEPRPYRESRLEGRQGNKGSAEASAVL